MADIKFAVQMVGFVEEGASQEFLAGFLVPFAVHVLGADGHDVGAGHVFAKVGDAEAAFALSLLAFGVDDLGVGKDQFFARDFL